MLEMMNLIVRTEEEKKFKKIIKQQFNISKIPKLMLGTKDGLKQYFHHFYEYYKFLGHGSFGFVVAGKDKANGQILALKVSQVSDRSQLRLCSINVALIQICKNYK